MVKTAQSVWVTRLVTLALAALAAGSAAYWVLQWPSSAAPLAPAQVVALAVPDTAAVGRALGGGAIAQPTANADVLASSRFVLTGVVTGGANHGAALIAVDGKPARAFRVGAVVSDPWVLRSVEPRRAVLGGSAGADMALDLPVKK